MKIKILFCGEGVTIPQIGLGLSFAGFKIWTGEPFRGFSTATNQGILGYAIVETPVIDLGDLGPERESLFRNLHGKVAFVKIVPNLFVRDGGIATITVTLKQQVGGALVEESVQFLAENCRGIAAAIGPIEFTVELLQLPDSEWSPYGSVIP